MTEPSISAPPRGTKPDVDLTDGGFYADRPAAREAYRWMRANEPLFRDRNGLAAATTYEAVIDAERNPELFSNAGGIRPDQDALPMMIDMDDPAHLLRRKLVNAGFTRKRLKVQDASIGALCDVLIDAVCERGECDFVRDIAAPLPMAVIGDMLGVLPDEREMFLKWSDEMMVGLSSTVSDADIQGLMDAFVAYNDYTRSKIEQRRAEPTEDLISVLVHSEVDGERLSDDDILQETLLILVGGDETTSHDFRWNRAADTQPRPVGSAAERLRPAPRRDRGDAALDVAAEEHVPHADRRHRIPWHAVTSGREDDADVRVGELRRSRLRRPGQLQYSARSEQPLSVRVRHTLLPW